MSRTVIKVEGLSKQYRLGEVGTGSLRHDLNRLWHSLRRKEDPYRTIGDENDTRTRARSSYVWALEDIDFSVGQGEVVGVIGRNGAGKSTLLKILSRTTAPTRGTASLKGRLASLLEIGTGFHPELSGRDNIFLNGAILGMRTRELRQKFDAIVDFSGVERYIDTPVKRYSSGMYVRLAFAVAAHLEPDILIVDEVLAVGDAEFQKKCLGKMKDVSEQEGRTILFVSHNLQAISTICSRGILLDNGRLRCDDTLAGCLNAYYDLRKAFSFDQHTSAANRLDRTNGHVRFARLAALKDGGENPLWAFSDDEPIRFAVRCLAGRAAEGLIFYMELRDLNSGAVVTSMKSVIVEGTIDADEALDFSITIPPNCVRAGQYEVYCALADAESRAWYDVIDANVGLPSLIVSGSTLDPHRNTGYVSIPYTVERPRRVSACFSPS